MPDYTRKIYFPFVITVFLLSDCSKSNHPITGTSSGIDSSLLLTTKMVHARLVEYGTGFPIAGAKVAFLVAKYLTDSNKWVTDSLISDASGAFSFHAYRFKKMTIEGNGYWTYDFNKICWLQYGLSSVFPGNLPFENMLTRNPNNELEDFAYACDSFVVKLVPKTFIRIHIRDSSGVNPFISFNSFGAPLDSGGPGYYIPLEGQEIILRPNIDTTMSYPVFGNIQNVLLTYDRNDAQYFYRNDTFIVKGASLFLDVVY